MKTHPHDKIGAAGVRDLPAVGERGGPGRGQGLRMPPKVRAGGRHGGRVPGLSCVACLPTSRGCGLPPIIRRPQA